MQLRVCDARCGGGGQIRGGGDVDEMDWHRLRHWLGRWLHDFGEGIFSLFAVDEAYRLAEFLRGHVLEAVEVNFGFGGFAAALQGLGHAEFGGYLEGIQYERALEGGNGFFVLLLLGINQAEEILGVGIVGIERRDFLEVGDGGVGVASGFFHQAQVEPGPGIARVALRGFLQDCAGFVEALQVEEGDAGVEAANVGLGIENAGALEFAESLFELLTIHQGDAEIVFSDYFGARVGGGLLHGGVVVGFCGGGLCVGFCAMRWLLRLRRWLLLLLLAGADERTSENRQENECAGEADHYSPFLSALDILPRWGRFGCRADYFRGTEDAGANADLLLRAFGLLADANCKSRRGKPRPKPRRRQAAALPDGLGGVRARLADALA